MISDLQKFLIELCGERFGHFLLGVCAVFVPAGWAAWRLVNRAEKKLELKIQGLEYDKSCTEKEKAKLESENSRMQSEAEQLAEGHRRELARCKKKIFSTEERLEKQNTSTAIKLAELERSKADLDRERIVSEHKLATALASRQELHDELESMKKQLAEPSEIETHLRTEINRLTEKLGDRSREVGNLQSEIQRQRDCYAGALRSVEEKGMMRIRKTEEEKGLAIEEKRDQEIKVSLLTQELESLRRSAKNSPASAPLPLPPLERCWEKPLGLSVPRFRPRSDRSLRIISLLNLKGGVGKTTIAANLGATLWREGKNVLMIDLDFQGSLTRRFLEEAPKGRCAEDFFKSPGNGLSAFITKVSMKSWGNKMADCRGQAHVLAADEPLADLETNMMVNWILGGEPRDVRFLLREALHADSKETFDCVLIDCPPRVTTACINAIACSDSVIVPVVLDKTSSDRVPLVLGWLSRLAGAKVCPDLTSVAVVANMTTNIKREREVWSALPGICEPAWRQRKLEFLDQQIKDDSGIGIAADLQFPAVLRKIQAFDPLRSVFNSLSAELQQKEILA